MENTEKYLRYIFQCEYPTKYHISLPRYDLEYMKYNEVLQL